MILILGGTSESREVAILCVQQKFPVLYTSTTDIIEDLPHSVERWIGHLTPTVFANLVDEWHISCVIDATHPFAVEISRQAMDVCSRTSIPYLRLEREALGEVSRHPHVRTVETVEESVRVARGIPGRILSTIGVRKLPEMVTLLGDRKEDLIARVLPATGSVAVCEKLGIHSSRIVAMQGPFCAQFDTAIIRRFGITVMVAKEAGDRGGLFAKIEACEATDCSLVLLCRPKMHYPQQVATPQECLPWIEKQLQRNG
jgi:precorrin-6A/cobalt-precorrin-6A reductase